MNARARLSPPNSILFVVTGEAPEVPGQTGDLVSATDTCVSIGTLMEFDGETEIEITDDCPSLGVRRLRTRPGSHSALVILMPE
jgi:hypothetical protein